MRRLLGLIRSLPVDAATWTRMRTVETVAAPAPSEPKKVDYEALRALGGQVITIPRKTG